MSNSDLGICNFGTDCSFGRVHVFTKDILNTVHWNGHKLFFLHVDILSAYKHCDFIYFHKLEIVHFISYTNVVISVYLLSVLEF